MKVLLEFGNRGGAVSRIVLPSARIGQDVALALANVFTDPEENMGFRSDLANRPSTWHVDRWNPAVSYQSPHRFISLSIHGSPLPTHTLELRKAPQGWEES